MRHIAGNKNVADHLSRIHHDDVGHLAAFISVFDKPAIFSAIKDAQRTCEEAWYLKLARAATDEAASPADSSALIQNKNKKDTNEKQIQNETSQNEIQNI